MFDDPRSGFDRRARRRNAVAVEGDKRGQPDRRVFRERQQSKPWWLMRRYIAVEKFLDGGSS